VGRENSRLAKRTGREDCGIRVDRFS
jgi:hypothetical protein